MKQITPKKKIKGIWIQEYMGYELQPQFWLLIRIITYYPWDMDSWIYISILITS